MSLTSLTRHPSAWVLVLHSGSSARGKEEYPNTFTPALISEFHARLDQVLEDTQETCALVVTGGHNNKFFCNGHDIEWLLSATRKENGKQAHEFLTNFYTLMARIMTFPIPTVAAINGHAFAGGCLLAMAMDYRVMRADKGFICMNEIDMALAPASSSPPKKNDSGGGKVEEGGLKPGMFKNADRQMMTIMQAKLTPLVVRDVFLKGLRMNADDACKLGLVDVVSRRPGGGGGDASTTDFLLQDALGLAKQLGAKCPIRNRRTWFVLKYESLGIEAINVLTEGHGLSRMKGSFL